jgi:nucleoside-diphosphate-sugar epimerase
MDRWSRANDLPLVTCIAGEAFGPWQSPSSFMARLVTNLLHDRPHVLAHGGETVRDWLPIRDLAAGLLLAAQSAPAQSHIDFSVGAERRDIDIAEAICMLLDERTPRAGFHMDLVHCEGDPAGAMPGPMLDPTDAERLLDWKPQGLYSGLDRLLSWALASRAAVQARSHAVAAE